jgi:hypothetical protein
MPKFPIERFPPGFFDLTQDLARSLPLDLIEQWTRGNRTKESALRLLAPHAVFGSVVSSDAAGLTSLSQARGVIEMLALVNHPKEIVHACGAAIGGQAVGVWAADNTQMFYPAGVDTGRLLSALLETIRRIGRLCQVRIGMCVHSGCFFRLGGGLYGTEADRVEHLAEEFTSGSEIIITDEFHQSLGRHSFCVEERTDLRHAGGRVWRVLDGPGLPDLPAGDERYPYPFSQEFAADLRGLGPAPAADGLRAMHEKYMRVRTVVLVERDREEPDIPEIAVLNDLALSAAMTKHAAPLLRATGGREVKTSGSLGIYTFEECAAGLEFARRFRALFEPQGVAIRAGIDHGEVLLFDIGDGLADIAGMPVNLASKIAQDRGEFGKIYLTAAAARETGAAGLERLEFPIAGTVVQAFSL